MTCPLNSKFVIAHLAASPFYGGPERQMVGLARAIFTSHDSVFLTFAENGGCEPLLAEVSRHGFEGIRLVSNYPAVKAAIREVAAHLRRVQATVLCCHGYKADLLGLVAARQIGIPVISISHGWTRATWKVRMNEAADRLCLRWMDRIVAVSEAQAKKICAAGIDRDRVTVIHNAVDASRFEMATKGGREALQAFFQSPRSEIIMAVGRLSPEKGFADLLEAMAILKRSRPGIGLLIVGDGPERERLAAQLLGGGLSKNVVLTGFRNDIERMLPNAELLAISSHTEGLPTVVLEAFAAGVPVVATRVGGIPEVIEQDVSGYLVSPGDPQKMAARINKILKYPELRARMCTRGRVVVREHFTFESQAQVYQRLFNELIPKQVAS